MTWIIEVIFKFAFDFKLFLFKIVSSKAKKEDLKLPLL